MLDKNELEALRERRWVLECSEMILTQRTSMNPRVLRGPGRFYQDSDGDLQLTLYAHDVSFPTHSSHPVGELVPEDAYFRLEATDFWGRRRVADQVDPTEDHSMPLRFTVAHGRVSPLRGWKDRKASERRRYALTGYMFAGLKFPSNVRSVTEQRRGRWQSTAGTWDVAEFPVDGVDLHIHHDGEEFVASAGSDTPIPPAYPSRLVEALRFVIADELWWDVLLQFEPERAHATIFSRRRNRLEATLPPPIQPNYSESFEHTTELFRCYLRYVLQDPNPELLHQLSAEWGEILRASVGTLQTQATIFCIGVEPLLRLIFSERPAEIQRDRGALAQVKRWTRRIRKFLNAEGCPEDLQKRFEGLFSPLTGLSDRDRFAWLAERGAIDPKLAERWQRLRPVSAHARREGQGEVDPLYQECMAVVGLLYQLIAHLIGYRGELTNFSEGGWPLRPYPLPVRGSVGSGRMPRAVPP